jgi:putative tricarboxylic transport membrane protein
MTERAKQRPGERIFLWLLLALSVCILLLALQIPREHLSASGAFPTLIACILVGAVIRILWRNRARYAALSFREELANVGRFALPLTVIGYALILLLYILTTAPLGFLPSSFGFLVVSFLFLRSATPLRALVIAAGTLGGIYLLFQTIFRVILW